MTSIDVPEVEYEFWCNRCRGEGKCPDQILNGDKIVDGPIIDCPKCGGAGYLVTSEGDKLLEFLRHQKVIR